MAALQDDRATVAEITSPSVPVQGLWRVERLSAGGAAVLLRGTTRATVAKLDGAAIGDWWRAPREAGGAWHRLFAAEASFPAPDGDVARMQADDQLRLRMIIARGHVLQAIRRFFWQRGFVEVDPPMLATSPGLELHLDAIGAHVREGMGGELTQRWLVTSPEYHCKRLLAAGMERIFSLQHAFRSGERGQHHNPEFAMLEWYRTDASYLDIVRDLQGLVRRCATALQADPITAPLLALDSSLLGRQPWPRLSIRQALQRYAGFDPGRYVERTVLQRARAAGLDIREGDGAAEAVVQALVERVEPALTAVPAVVLDRWPAQLASLAAPFPQQPWLAQRFEVYLSGVELANGFTELTDAAEQERRFRLDLAARERLGRLLYPMDERFLSALRDGCPPAAGVALGVDRLLLALTGRHDIDEALFFPFERA